MMDARPSFTAAALILALGITAGGWFIGEGFHKARQTDRYVTVKGVSERTVTADTGLWPLKFTATNDDLALAQQSINASKRKVLEFVKRQGIEADQVEVQNLEVNDLLANAYRSGPTTSRYIITMTLMITSNDPSLLRNASQRLEELVTAGVVLASENYSQAGPTYLFTGLSKIKPDMIAEATANARRAAAQFAKDSGSHIGTIRKANQGVFVILPHQQIPGASQTSQIKKTVRVVSTIEYYLED